MQEEEQEEAAVACANDNDEKDMYLCMIFGYCCGSTLV